ncbi:MULTISPECIES: DoxX family protein [Bacteria]|uniref:DoxX family protein n=1 Tax=Bacteria TaxID=2 RepID=UPI003C7AF91F
MSTTTTGRPSASFGLLILRVVVGAIFVAHGAQKVFEFTIPGTVQAFAGMGAPLPEVVGPFIAFLELIGGLLLVVGLLTRPVALLLAVDMVGAIVLVHLPAGLWVSNGGYEFVALLGGASLALVFTGAGAFAIDRVVLRGPVRALA